ncbi:MAG: peptidase S8, partial [Candidatus Eremiobacteraeota bacterium]|nr:peptidase S8 [Candidatus Eremiobacteraeota bacterium]
MKLVAPLAAALAVAACSGGSSSVPTVGASQTKATLQTMTRHIPQWKVMNQAREVCPMVYAKPTCLALTAHSTGPSPLVAGLAPADLEAAYNLPITQGSGQIVAIVDAYDNPNIASDLTTYRNQFSLGSVTFNKYNQNGQQSNYPSGSTGWGTEEDLDVDMVSAACPKCTIYLIEA